MKTEQFNQLQGICAIDGLCYSLDNCFDDIEGYLPEEIADEAGALRMAVKSFRDAVCEYINRNKKIYIDEEE